MSTSLAPPTSAVPRLLVSVRDANELRVAIGAGVCIIDLKDPKRGALAAADPTLWRLAAALAESGSAAARVPCELSAALGESDEAPQIAARVPPTFAFAKVGPSGCDTPEKLTALWCQIRRRLDPAVELVGVAYADFCAAASLAPDHVFRLAAEFGLRRCLIDTCVKDGRSTVDHLDIGGLKRLARVARDNQIWWTLAGSIRADQVERLRAAGIVPDCYGVRGDVCERGRTGQLSSARIEHWNATLTRSATLGRQPDR